MLWKEVEKMVLSREKTRLFSHKKDIRKANFSYVFFALRSARKGVPFLYVCFIFKYCSNSVKPFVLKHISFVKPPFLAAKTP